MKIDNNKFDRTGKKTTWDDAANIIKVKSIK